MTKGSIFDLKRFAIHDGPGIRTTVFMRGCPLNCWWCHNPESRQPLAMDTAATGADGCTRRRSRTALADGPVSPEQVIDEVARDIPYYDQSDGGVTFSGGEPLMQFDFLMKMLQLCRGRSIHTAVDTTGYAPTEDLERLIDLVDLFLYDLKIMDDHAHEQHVGVSNRLILDNLKMLATRGARVIIRVPLIPGITDTDPNLDAIIQFVKPLPGVEEISLLTYHRYFRHKVTDPELAAKLAGLQPKTQAEVSAMSQRLEAHGLRVKIGG
jgi:pyruvate formate lyase activating enzyme